MNGPLFSDRGAWHSSSSLAWLHVLVRRRRDLGAIPGESFQPRSVVSTYFDACACACMYVRAWWTMTVRRSFRIRLERAWNREEDPSVDHMIIAPTRARIEVENVVGFREAWSFVSFRTPLWSTLLLATRGNDKARPDRASAVIVRDRGRISVIAEKEALSNMSSVWKRLQRVNKRAAKFQFTVSYHEVTLETTTKWWVTPIRSWFGSESFLSPQPSNSLFGSNLLQ